eukprot:g4630.t1
MKSVVVVLQLAAIGLATPAGFTCTPSLIANSSRASPAAACTGEEGDECAFECDAGFIPVGRHVCQDYSTMGALVINQSFFGGRCDALCNKLLSSCDGGNVPVRFRASAGAPCLTTLCLAPDDALRRLARGAYEVFARGRNEHTGVYMDHVDPSHQGGDDQPMPRYASSDSTGVGLAAEAVAAALGFVDAPVARRRVVLTLRSMVGRTPGFRVPRNAPAGFLPTFFDAENGSAYGPASPTGGPNVFSTDSTAFFTVGMLFARRYLVEGSDPARADPASTELAALADALLAGVSLDRPFCGALVGLEPEAAASATGTAVPWLFNATSGCSDSFGPAADGMYDFSEMFWYAWLARERPSSVLPGGAAASEALFRAWAARAAAPNYAYAGRALLTLWPSYVVQLPYYLVHPFNSDPSGRFQALLRAQWQAEWAFANSTLHAGEGGRYGQGAGPTAAWCSGTTYKADLIDDTPGAATCRMYSPYAVAGYLPAAPGVIRPQLLQLLAAGEAVLPLAPAPAPAPAAKQTYVLWRKSLLDRSWSLGYGITLVDFAAELYGLSTLWLGSAFFANNTNHWPSA